MKGVRYAFHFVDDGEGWNRYDESFLRALLELPGRRHFLVRRGNVVHWDFGKGGEQIRGNAAAVFESASSTMSLDEYLNLITTAKPYVLLVQGMTADQVARMSRRLQGRDEYVGALGLQFDVPLHWAVYGSGLLNAYRLIGDELRLQHGGMDVLDEDVRDHAAMRKWKQSHLFSLVTWENVGLRSTIFDTFDSPNHEAIVGETEGMLADLMESVANEVLLRAIDLDPRLVETLHAALHGLMTARTSEQLAQAALSCRRFMERLADRVFPPVDVPRDGRDLGPSQWRNRLWAYAEDAIGANAASDVDASLRDIGNRIDSVAAAAQSGLHRPEVEQIATTRLIVGLASLTYDLALLSAPPYELPGDSYEPQAVEMLREMLTSDNDD